MSHIIPIKKINQFLPLNKLELHDPTQGSSTDHSKVQDLEESARDIVLAKLSYRIDTSNWFSAIDPPDLVINIMGMLVAGWVYDRQFAEESTEGATYGRHKEAEAYRLLEGILDGRYKLEGTLYLDDPDRLPSTYDTDPIFTMGQRI